MFAIRLCFTAVLMIAASILAPECNAQDKTSSVKNKVVVMGMIHSGHLKHQVYDVDRIKSLIRQINPDYVLTEIPPDRLAEAAQQFRETGTVTESRVRVFPEYTDALFPLTKELNFEIVPCAAWTTEMNDHRREVMSELKTSHSQEYAEMEAAQDEAATRISKLGDANDPAAIHTDLYDAHVKTGMQPYNSHFNELIGDGGWENINAAHYAHIDKALDKLTGKGSTFLITFGSWHKYYIKEQLAKRNDIEIVSLASFLKTQSVTSNSDEPLEEFETAWSEDNWEQDFRGLAYMRTGDDAAWKNRVVALQGLVAGGSKSIEMLEKSLASENVPTRILAAQALSYLATLTKTEMLASAFKNENDPAVRLYLADAIGMSGHGSQVDWAELAKDEKNRDVQKHIGYAKDRQDSPVSDAVAARLSNWDADTIDSASVGKQAPDFSLKSVDGTEYRLSQFRGKQPVVLVFIYGDT